MIDDEFIERRPDDLEVYRRLDAFAQVRLAPDPAAMARIRSALMGQAVAFADAGVAGLAMQTRGPVRLPERPAIVLRPPHVSRWSAAFLAACLTLGLAAGSVAASGAGGPLYGPRLWLEEANLPRASMARAMAQLERLDARVLEIQSATASGNAGAAEAALDAYGDIVADLEAQARAEPVIGSTVLDDLARRQIVLMGLLGDVPPQAVDALQHALQQGANAVEVMDAEDGNPGDPVRSGGGGPGTNDGQGGSGSQGGSSSSGGSGGQGGAGSGSGEGTQGGAGSDGNPPGQDPASTSKPERPAKPETTPKKPASEPMPAPPTPANPGSESGQGGESSPQDASGRNDGDAD